MNSPLCTVKKKWEGNRSLLLYCLISTFILGLIAHAYMFFQDTFSHDSLNELNSADYNEWKIQLGRFLIPLYKTLTRGSLTLTWIIGLYSLLWTSLAVFFTAKLFDIKNKLFITLIGGIYTVNVTVIATTATYMHDLDVDMFALFMAVLAAYLWKRYRLGFLLAPLCLIVTLGLYQCYLSVAICLIFMSLIIDLLNGKACKSMLFQGLKGAGSVLLGGLVYGGAFRLVLSITKIPELLDNYNSLDLMFSMTPVQFLTNIKDTYLFTWKQFLYPHTTLPKTLVLVVTIAALVLTLGMVVWQMVQKKLKVGSIITASLLLILLPLMTNISKVLSNGMSHDLMHFSIWLLYLLILLVAYKAVTNRPVEEKPAMGSCIAKGARAVCVVIVAVILLSNVMLANQLYLKKDLEQDAAISYFTRVIAAIDEYAEESMFDKETDMVYFVGKPPYSQHAMPGFEDTEPIIGSLYNYALGAAEPMFYESFFKYRMHYEINLEPGKWKYGSEAKNMPAFPEFGCMRMVGNTLVVKLGD